METDLNVTMEHEDMSSDFFDFVSLNIKIKIVKAKYIKLTNGVLVRLMASFSNW